MKNWFSTAIGADAARRRPGPVLLVIFMAAGVTALAVVPALAGTGGFAVGLLAIGPCLAATAVSPRAVAVVGAYTMALGTVLLAASAMRSEQRSRSAGVSSWGVRQARLLLFRPR